jgi:dimeric dUTPase (all-alpha-NTP-PPase superfamily)
MDKLEQMFELQRVLNERILNEPSENLNAGKKIQWILNYSRALQQELSELVDCVPWKWWAHYQQFDEQNARVEVVDIMHFLISIARVLGMTADDLFEAYAKKNVVNHRRQDSGYIAKEKDDSHI